MKREEKEREIRRQENYNALRVQYCKWFLDDDVNVETEKTTMVLFNPDTGGCVPVKNYKDIANYFNSLEYVSFLTKTEFDENLHRGLMKFLASTSGYEVEEWFRFIFIRDPSYE